MQLPKITINANSKISIRRLLPVPGQILVQQGQKVEPLSVVAQAEMPSRYRVIDVARQLGQLQPDMNEVMQVAEGDYVDTNAVIAVMQGGLSFLQRSVRSPVAGHVAAIGPGWVLLETERTTIEVQAFINGVINRVLGDRGVIIDSEGAMIEAACGFGGEAFGRLKRLANSPFEALNAEAFDESTSETIILGGRTLDEETLRHAEAWHVRGIIVGSIPASLLNLDPPTKVRVVATEGFGDVAMSPYTFGILTSLSRREISIRGQPPYHLSPAGANMDPDGSIILASGSVRAGVGSYSSTPLAKASAKPDVTIGSRVRVIQGKLLGTTGIVESIPLEPRATPAGIIAPGANVKFNNDVIYIPWANLEQVI
jgi:hypothetical protein